MKKFNLRKKANAGDYTIGDKMLDKNRKDMNLSIEQQGVVEKNINLSLPTKDKDNTVPFNKQLDSSRNKDTEKAITEANMSDKIVFSGEKSEGVMPINVRTEEYNQKKLDDYKKAENTSKKDTEFWDKYVGVQLEGKKTTVDNNIPASASQLGNHPNRFKGKDIDKLVMASIKDADAMLFHIYSMVSKENRDLNIEEKQQVIDINAGKTRLLAQMVAPVRRSLEYSDPVIKKERGIANVIDQEEGIIDTFKSCEEAKINYPEAEIKGG